MLAVSSNAYAAYATNLLFEKHPEIKAQYGASAFEHWKSYFSQRIKELSVAMEEHEPSLFVSQIRWDRAAFKAREVSDECLVIALKCLKATLNEELPNGSSRLSNEYLDIAINSYEQLEVEKSSLDTKDEQSQLAAKYLLKILEGNSQEAIKSILEAQQNGLSMEDTYMVLMRAQNQIGEMWHRAEVSVAEEHYVTNTTRRAMSVLAYFAQRKPANGLTVVSSAVAGNNHDIGVRAISDFFEFDGWRAVCTGGDNPPEEVAKVILAFDASLVLISAALPTQLRATRETIEKVRVQNSGCKIMVGGEAFRESPDLWKQFEADAYATTPNEALVLGNKLCGL